MAILTCDNGYGQMVWYTASGGGGICASVARIAAGYNSGAPRLDFSIGASSNMLPLTCDGTVGLGTAVEWAGPGRSHDHLLGMEQNHPPAGAGTPRYAVQPPASFAWDTLLSTKD